MHVFDSLDFVQVSLDPPMRHQETEQLAGWNSKNTFFRVQALVQPSKVVEGFLQIFNEGGRVMVLDHNVVDVSFHVAPDLGAKTEAHGPLEGGPHILEPKGHACVAV